MKRYHFGSLILALGLCAAPALHAQAQPTEGIRFGVGGGVTLPMGNYGDFDKGGCHLVGRDSVPDLAFGDPPSVRRDVRSDVARCRQRQDHVDRRHGRSAVPSGDRAASVRPYVLGGLGVYNVDAGGGSETDFTFGFGGGILFGIGTMHAFLEARYMSIQASGTSLPFIPISLGVMFGQ